MPKSSERHSSNVAASASRSGDSIRADGPHRDLAVVREPLAAQAEAGVEAGPEVLERHPGGELDELRITEVVPEAGSQLVGDLGRVSCRRLRVLEHHTLAPIEEITRTPVHDRPHLGRVDAALHPLEVAVVDAPGA